MKICQVISSYIPIKPTGERGWGAVELIIDEYRKGLIKLGHQVDIKWLNEIQPNEYDIVHISVANLCLEAHKRGIEYIYSTHDHHSYYYGKDSNNYKEQLEAIKKSIFSFAPAEYVVDYFDETDKLFYLSHGVDTSYYLPKFKNDLFDGDFTNHKLLMCANNGVAGIDGADRKGFRFGIEAAKELGLPITVVGADANTRFFKVHKDLLEYEKLTVIDTNPTEDEKLKIFQDHTIFLHPSNLEYGHPNLTLLESESLCMPMVGTIKCSKNLPGMFIMNELSTNEVVKGIKLVIGKYGELVHEMSQKRHQYDWSHVCKQIEKNYYAIKQCENFDSQTIKAKYIDVYNNTKIKL
jgi:glycosyltransferase involved in cell wall biosynthesis